MPQYVTFNISAKVDKGPEVKSEAKFDGGPYGAVIEEQVCKCNKSDVIELMIDDVAKIDLLAITADKYSVDKEACALPNNGVAYECKRIKYWFVPVTADEKIKDVVGFSENKPFELSRPHVLVDQFFASVVTVPIKGIVVQNDLTADIKVSALVVRKSNRLCR